MSKPAPALDRRALEAARSFLRAFSHAVKQVSLYGPRHPAALSVSRDAWQMLHDLFAESGWLSAVIGLSAGRWLVNEEIVADSAQEYELLAAVFRGHALQTITFKSDCRSFEFLALCEFSATPVHRASSIDPEDFLKGMGVSRIEVNVEEYVRARKVKLPASSTVQSPLAGVAARLRRAASAAPKAPAEASASEEAAQPPQSFGTFIKSLVERGISDPKERAVIYAEALRHVEEAVARHVSEATHRLLLEKQGVLNERLRSESVLTTLAKGRVIIDQEGRIVMMDPAAEKIVGRPLADVAGKPLLENAKNGESFAALSKDLILSENRPGSGEVDVSGAPGALEALRQAVAVVHDEGGRVVGTYGVLPHAAKFKEAQRVQDEFVASVTHDLKAPLASICSALELLKERLPAAGPDESEFLDIGLRNSKILQGMINELLDFSKIQSGRLQVRLETTPALGLLEEAARSLAPWAARRKIDLRIERREDAAELPPVRADKARIIQVLNNLLSNAIKFTPEGGRVTLSVFPDPDNAGQALFCVKDTGPGIPRADQGRIFARFVQGSAGQSREGVGLGLSIAKELVALHHGRLWVVSEPGKGAEFRFTLPVVR